MKAKIEFYLGTLEKDKYALDISIYQRGGNVFRFSPIYKGDIDKVTWVIDDNLAQSETLAPTESIIKKFTENGVHTIKAIAYTKNQKKAETLKQIFIGNKNYYMSISVENPIIEQETFFNTTLYGITTNNIKSIQRNR